MSRLASLWDEDSQRNDSALGLALDRPASSHAFASRRGPVASPSWSSYNLRQDSLTDSTYETPASSVYEYTSATLVPASPIDTPALALCNSVPQASPTSAGETIVGIETCEQCQVDFTGTYRRGNLARHMRNKHQGNTAKVYVCRAEACSRLFNRQDARLKHERNTHPELNEPPLQAQTSDDIIVGADDNTSNLTEAAVHDQVSMLPVASWRVLYEIHARLDSAKYSQFCDTVFSRWATLAQALKDQESHAYDVFAQVLADLHHVVEAIDCNLPEHDSDTGQQQCPTYPSRAPQAQPSQAQHASAGIGPARRSSTSLNQARHPQGQRDNKGQRSRVTVSKHGKVPDLQPRKLDCPLYKHWFIYLQNTVPPPCNGCSERYMSQIRNHVKRSHVGQEGGPIAYYHHCVRCNENFVDYLSANNHTTLIACAHVPEPRGDPMIPWAKLYLKVYPDATAIPSPYTGEVGWTPPSVLTRCQQVAQSFLGQRSQTQVDPTQSSNHRLRVSGQLSYEVLQGIMLQEAIDQATLLGMDTLSPNLQVLTNNRTAFIGQLDDARTRYLELLRAAPRYLWPTEIAEATRELHSIADIAQAYEEASVTLVAPSLGTGPSEEGIQNVFSDLALSPQTDQTPALDTCALSPSGKMEPHESILESPGPDARRGAISSEHGPNDLAFFDLGPDIGGEDFDGSLNFDMPFEG